MAIDADSEIGKTFLRLARQLHDRRTGRVGNRKWNRGTLASQHLRPPLQLLDDYRKGDPPLRQDIHSGWKPYIRQFIRMGRLNQADLLISSTTNRMQLRDFRTAAANDELGDEIARSVMRANDYKLLARELHDTTLTLGDGYTITQPPGRGEKFARITGEDPREVITEDDPLTGRERAGLKLFRNAWDDEDLAYLHLPGKVFPIRHTGRTALTTGPFRLDLKQWSVDEDKIQGVPGGRLAVVHFRNRDGQGEYERHLDTLDRINDKIFDEWWIAKIQAFRQRAVKNLPDTKDEIQSDGTVREVPVADDEYDDMFTASPDEMWQVPADVEFWESSTVDLTPITNAIEKDRARLASSTSTPLHTITPDAAAGSAEGAALLREEHVFKVEDRRDRMDGGHSRTMSLALLFQNETARADVTQIEPIWGPVERYSLAEKAEASSKAKLPQEAIWRDIWQYAPAEIPELRVMAGRELILQARRDQGAGSTGS